MADKSPRIALVTGGNRGIGFEVCRQLAEHGFVVLLTARDATKATTAANKLAKTGTVESIALDVADPHSIQQAAADVESRYDHLDVLINNAGINYDTWETVENADINGTVIETITTNLLGSWRVCQAFLPLLRVSPAARVVNVSSESGSHARRANLRSIGIRQPHVFHAVMLSVSSAAGGKGRRKRCEHCW